MRIRARNLLQSLLLSPSRFDLTTLNNLRNVFPLPCTWISKEFGAVLVKWLKLQPYTRKIHSSRKSVRMSAVPVPWQSRLCLKLNGRQGSDPKGVDDLCFHTLGEFSPSPLPPSLSLPSQIHASRPKFQSWSPNPSLEAKIPVLRLKSKAWGPNYSLDT